MASHRHEDEKCGGTNSSTTQTNEPSNPLQAPTEGIDAQVQCIRWAEYQEWDHIKEYAEEYGPGVLLGVYNYTHNNEPRHDSVLQYAAHWIDG